MGKGIIKAELEPKGLYLVDIVEDVNRDKEISRLDNIISNMESKIPENEVTITAKQGEIDSKNALIPGFEFDIDELQGQIDALGVEQTDLQDEIKDLQYLIDHELCDIPSCQAQIAADKAQIALLQDEINAKQNQITDLNNQIATLRKEIRVLERDIDGLNAQNDGYKLQIENLKLERDRILSYSETQPDTREAWLANYPTDENKPKIGQEIGIIEMDREYNSDVLNIFPSYENEHEWNKDRDGIMIPVGLMNPFWQYFNIAVAPGVQKWFPRYRHGEIYNIDREADTASVALEQVFAQSGSDPTFHHLNRQDTLYGVPIHYPPCDSEPFEDWDNVLVKFENNDWAKPKIIGFKTDPKECDSRELVFVSLGELGFIWDLKIDSYWEKLPGIQLKTACETKLSGKIETTRKYNEFDEPLATKAFPYKKMFWQLWRDADYTIFSYDYVTLGLDPLAPDESCGRILEQYKISEETIIIDKIRTRTTEWSESTCLFGTLQPAWTLTQISEIIPGGGGYPIETIETFSHLGTVYDIWSANNYVCPIDWDMSYYSKCGLAEFGNDAINVANNGFRYSEKTLVQIFYNVYAQGHRVYPDPIVYSPRTTVALAGCSTLPFDDPPEMNPINQPKNDLFSEAVYDLIEGLYTYRGLTSGEPGPVVGQDWPNHGKGSAGGTCKDGYTSFPYYRWVNDPELNVKIYKRN